MVSGPTVVSAIVANERHRRSIERLSDSPTSAHVVVFSDFNNLLIPRHKHYCPSYVAILQDGSCDFSRLLIG